MFVTVNLLDDPNDSGMRYPADSQLTESTMSEIWVDVAADCCGPDYRPATWRRLAFKLLLAYLLLAALCWIESKFQQQAVEVEAKVETVGQGPKNSVLVRYHFHDPVTGKPRMNTEAVRPDHVPQTQTAVVEYIPGEYPWSRLKSEARPGVRSFFFWVNVVFFSGVAGLIGYIAWEANHPLGGKKKRGRIPYHVDPSPKRWKIS